MPDPAGSPWRWPPHCPEANGPPVDPNDPRRAPRGRSQKTLIADQYGLGDSNCSPGPSPHASAACTAAPSLVSSTRNGDPLVVRRGIGSGEGGSSSADFVDDLLGGDMPDERLGVVVPVLGPGLDGVDELGDAGEYAVAEAPVGELFEPALDEVEPRR